MTQIGGYIAPSRRAGVLGVHSLDHFSMSVPDLAAAKAFYESFGLDVLGRQSAGALHAWRRTLMHGVHGSDHHLMALALSGGPGLHQARDALFHQLQLFP